MKEDVHKSLVKGKALKVTNVIASQVHTTPTYIYKRRRFYYNMYFLYKQHFHTTTMYKKKKDWGI